MQNVNNLEDSVITLSLTFYIALDCIYFSIIPVVGTIIYDKRIVWLIEQSIQMYTNYRGQC